MIEKTEIDTLKANINIVDVLHSHGYQPAYQTGNELVYTSPFRNEKTPSFHVNQQLNSFKDFGESDHRGDVIRFVQLLKKIDFYQAVQYLKTWKGETMPTSFSFSGYTCKAVENEPRIKVRNVKAVQHPALIQYLESRCISFAIGSKYLKEVHYTYNDKYRFGLGFENDKGGFAIRNSYGTPNTTKPAHYTSFIQPGSTSINLFEGFFDFLSALEYYQTKEPSRTTIVLNSVGMLHRSLDTLKTFQKVYCYLDHDDAGKKALDRLQAEGIEVVDKSDLYRGYKDLNEYYQVYYTTK
jgi:DNA primase